MVRNPLFERSAVNAQQKAPVGPVPDILPGWRVLVVDDDEEVHTVTRLILRDIRFEGRPLQMFSAFSAVEGAHLMNTEPDIALAIIDVVMETDHAGLGLVKQIREEMSNQSTRLVLRTGQPGQAPEHEVIRNYDINDYKDKTELTSQKLRTMIYSALRSYRDICTIERHQRGLKRVIESTTKVLQSSSLQEFASAVLAEVINLLQLQESALYCVTLPSAEGDSQLARTLAATGDLIHFRDEVSLDMLPAAVRALLERAMQERRSLHDGGAYVLFAHSESGHDNLLYFSTTHQLDEMDRELLEIYCNHVALTYENLLISEDLSETQREMVYLLGEAVEQRSKETGAHVRRVSLFVELLAKLAGVSPYETQVMKRASPLHDLGKIAIPDAILHKPGKLVGEEWEIMKTHAQAGTDILQRSRRPVLRCAAEIAGTHHEKWDGSGYPNGMSGETIPLSGRITALADVFDALGSRRCYKEPWSRADIMDFIRQQSGRHFDPRLVDLLVLHQDQFWLIRDQHPDDPPAAH